MTITVETGILGGEGSSNCQLCKVPSKNLPDLPTIPPKLFLPPAMKQMMPSVYCTWLQHPYHTCSIWLSCSAYLKRSQQKKQKTTGSNNLPGHFWGSGNPTLNPFISQWYWHWLYCALQQNKISRFKMWDYNLNLVIWEGFFGYLGEHPSETRVKEGLTKRIEWCL